MQIAYVAVTIVVAFANGYAAVLNFARAESVKVMARQAPRSVRKIFVPNGPGHPPWCGVNAASRVAVIRPAASSASSRPAAASSAAACMRL